MKVNDIVSQHTDYKNENENINKNTKLIEKISHELDIVQCEQQNYFLKFLNKI